MMGAQRAIRSGLTGVVVAVALLLYLAWELSHRGVFLYNTSIYSIDDADEWRYTACSRLVDHGYALFSQVFSAQPPVLFLSLAGGMRLFGETITGARPVEIAFGLVTLVASAWMVWMMAGPLGAGITAVLLAISPAFLVYSHTIEAEGPMMALVTLSLALALAYQRTRHPLLPALAGLVMAAAILTKLFALEALAPGLWLIAVREGRLRANLAPVVLFVACGLIPVVLELLLVSPLQQWQQVVAMHNSAAHAALPDLTPPSDILSHFFGFDAGLTAVAVAGLLTLALARRVSHLIFLLLWLGGSTIMLWLFRPLFPHHPAILISGLAVAAGTGLGQLSWLPSADRWRWLLPPVAGAAIYLAFLPRLIHDDRHLLYAGSIPQRAVLVRYVGSHTGPRDLVAVDDVAVADIAGRLVPPPLCDPSNVRLRSGYLTAAMLIGATEEYHPSLVLPASGLYQQVPAYLHWLSSHYRHEAAPDPLGAFWRRS